MRRALHIARALALFGVVMLAGGAPPAQAQDDGVLERQVKAAFLYKFTGFVSWPSGSFASPDTPLIIGVIGDDQLAAETAQIVAGRTVDGRPLAVRRLNPTESAAGVHILFVARPETARFAQIAKALPPTPMLVVTESEAAFKQGSAINFVLQDGRVRFDVSVEAAERRGARLSSRLLAVARTVQGTQQ
jgi:hypothetical protein